VIFIEDLLQQVILLELFHVEFNFCKILWRSWRRSRSSRDSSAFSLEAALQASSFVVSPRTYLASISWRSSAGNSSRLCCKQSRNRQAGIALLFSSGIASGAARHHFQPGPKDLLRLKHSCVTGHSQQCLLQRFLRFILITSRHHQKKAIKPIEIVRMELAESRFISGSQPARQHDDAACLRRGTPFHGFSSG
jgi:hypothetical protein